MELITKDTLRKAMREQFDYSFAAPKEGLYIIEISARARGEKQVGKDATNDDDLRIEIDGRKFPKLDNPTRYLDSPAAFSGGQLHNLKRTVFFFIQLSKGKHAISFVPDGVPRLEEMTIEFAGNGPSKIDLNINQQAEDGDRRPWITFVLVDLPLTEVQSVIRAERRFLDSDDVKIIIDDKIERNPRNGLRKFWFWLGSKLKSGEEINRFNTHIKRGLHYVEFWADRTPTLQGISFNFGEVIQRIPNVYDPEWIGDSTFKDDSEQMILARAIFGEARNVHLSDEARVAVAWSIKNRVNLKAWGKDYHEVILKPRQYSSFKKDDSNHEFVLDPLHQDNLIDKKSWIKCYEIAGKVINGRIGDPTDGATAYHDISYPQEKFITKDVPGARFIKRIDRFMFYFTPR